MLMRNCSSGVKCRVHDYALLTSVALRETAGLTWREGVDDADAKVLFGLKGRVKNSPNQRLPFTRPQTLKPLCEHRDAAKLCPLDRFDFELRYRDSSGRQSALERGANPVIKCQPRF